LLWNFYFFLFFRKLHGKTIRTYQDTDSNVSPNDDDLSIKNLDLLIDSTAPTTENPSTSLQANGRDRKAYLKSLEQSLRTGRRIQNDNNAPEDESHSNPFNFISHCINKHIHQKTTDTHTTTEL
jgi:hypothetical protein